MSLHSCMKINSEFLKIYVISVIVIIVLVRQHLYLRLMSVTLIGESSDNVTRAARKTNNTDQICTNSYVQSCNPSSQSVNMQTNNINPFSINLKNKGYNIGHLNIQGICGNNLCKFSELSLMLTSKDYENLHIFGMR